ncbi:MAG TPA: hypothetical protein VLC46_04210 [Thermoanaerobaculia bacterium]|nr:hypothetical protein [Thermoanaerobaculia bacterium]
MWRNIPIDEWVNNDLFAAKAQRRLERLRCDGGFGARTEGVTTRTSFEAALAPLFDDVTELGAASQPSTQPRFEFMPTVVVTPATIWTTVGPMSAVSDQECGPGVSGMLIEPKRGKEY